jgi:hypothetical protein
MKALICTNENNEVVSIHISTNENILNEKMRRDFQTELLALEDEGYDLDEVESDFAERDSAYIKASENYQYLWVIKGCVEV